MGKEKRELSDREYEVLAEFRFTLRAFMKYSEEAATRLGLTAQQHQVLLIIRATAEGEATVGYVADRLMVKPHSASGLVDRLEKSRLVQRRWSDTNRRQAIVSLEPEARKLLSTLSEVHRDEIRRLRPLLIQLMNDLGE